MDKNNYWFAAAYVNRVWGELMGQAFCQPVDDMGPDKEVVFPDALARLAAKAAEVNVAELASELAVGELTLRDILA